MKKYKGITLIALIITIVILLVLVGITISAISGEIGLINKTIQARKKYEESTAREIIKEKMMDFQMYCMGQNDVESYLEYMKEIEYFKEDKEIKDIDYYSLKIASIDWNDYEKNGFGKLKYAKISLNKYEYIYTIDENLQIVEINDIPIKEYENKNENKGVTEESALEYLYDNSKLPSSIDELINNEKIFAEIIESKNNIDYILSNPDVFLSSILSNNKNIEIICNNEYFLQGIINNEQWYNQILNSDYKSVFETATINLLKTSVNMTSNTNPKYKAIATSEYQGSYKAYLAFDGKNDTFWYSNGFTNGNGGQAIGYDFGEDVYIYRFEFVPRNNGSDTKSVSKYNLEASDDGINWEIIKEYTNTDMTDGILLSDNLKMTKMYKQYRIQYISTFNGSGTTYASVRELKFYCYKNDIVNTEMKDVDKSKYASYGETLSYLYANTYKELEFPNKIDDLLSDSRILEKVLSNNNNINYILKNPEIFKNKIITNKNTIYVIAKIPNAIAQFETDSEYLNWIKDNTITVPQMTSTSSPSGVVSSSNYYDTNYSYKAFDGDIDTRWESNCNNGNDYIQYEFKEPNSIYKFSIYPKIYDGYLRVKDIVLCASNDGENFIQLTDILTCNNEENITFNVSANQKYKYYRIIVKNMHGGNSNNDIMINEIQFYCIK